MIRSGLDEDLGPAVPCGRFRHAHQRRHQRGARGGPARHRRGCRRTGGRGIGGRTDATRRDGNDATRACGSAKRADNAQAAGARGALLSSTVEHFAAGIAGNAAVPMFQFTGSSSARLRPALEAGTLVVRLYGSGRASLQTYDQSIVDSASSFTSRGVRGPAVKPDVAAPGDTISSALRGSGHGRMVLSGTSMAAPHTAGVAALVRQAHPEWSAEEIKAAVVGTAGHDVVANGKTYAPQRVGTGRVDAKAAVGTGAVAYVADDQGAVGVSFGTVEADGPVFRTKTVKVVNHGDRPVTYRVACQDIDRLPGVRYQISPNTVRIPPRGTGLIRVTLQITDAASLRKVPDATVETVQAGLPRQFVADASGRIVLTPEGDGVPLRAAVYAAPKPVSAITTPDRLWFTGDLAVLRLGGRGIDQGEGDARYQSLISVLELQASSPRLPPCQGEKADGCTVNARQLHRSDRQRRHPAVVRRADARLLRSGGWRGLRPAVPGATGHRPVVTRNAASAAQDTVQGLLALELHNGAGRRNTVVRLHSNGRLS